MNAFGEVQIIAAQASPAPMQAGPTIPQPLPLPCIAKTVVGMGSF